ncbi:MAG TPA: SAM-dependent methyltransferase [Gammaproteobacteria bacterium]|nr:SAM-dependent methyltransferase [Gammaproteobacteria bacterium]
MHPADPGLPPPDPAAAAHSARLISHIRGAMRAAGGRLPFDRYMALALHAPGLGYYSAGARKFGAGGDFVTAPEISPLFSRCVARQAAAVLAELGGGEVLEVGAGSGAMAAAVLTELAALGQVPERYAILELSGDLRQRQQATVARHAPALAERVVWLETLPAAGFRGVVLANELLDALPVRRFLVTEDELLEAYVGWENGRFAWTAGMPQDGQLGARVRLLREALGEETLYPGYASEINFAAEAWLASLAKQLDAGMILLIDYGYPRHEYYHPARRNGTLMCHYRHRAHDDPLILPGLQDITCHVDFTALAEAGCAAGLEVAGYTTQGYFLLGTGITEMQPPAADPRQQLEWAQQIKTLTLPHEMGELFKVLALTRDVAGPLSGFQMRDLRDRL